MRVHRKYVKEGGHAVYVNHFQKAYQLVIPVGADKRAPIQICSKLLSDGLYSFAEVPEAFPLSNRRFVVNPVDASYEILIKRDNFYRYAPFGSTPDILP